MFLVTNHTRTEKIGGDSILFFGHPSRVGNRYDRWQGMKRDIVEFVSKCLVCQQVKPEHRKPWGKMSPLPIP